MNTRVRPEDLAKLQSQKSVDQLLRDLKSTISYRTLEPRIAFDGAAVATVVATSDPQQTAAADTLPAMGEPATATTDTTGADAQDVTPVASENENSVALFAAVVAAPGTENSGSPAYSTIVFIDSAVNNVDQLIKAIDPKAEIILIDHNTSGVEQIAYALSGRTGITSIHIVSHGSEGELYLGNGVLNAESMQGEYLDELTVIRDALTSSGDILIYGCDFTGGDKGLQAAMILGSITEADIAASVDATGAADLGGDWILESHLGGIETVAIDAGAWEGLLAPSTATLDWHLVGNHTFGATGTTYTIGALTNAVTIRTTGTGSVTNDDTFATSGTGDPGLGMTATTTSTTVGQTTEIIFNASAFPLGVITAQFDIRNIDAGTWDDRVIVQAYDVNGVLLLGTNITATPRQVAGQTYSITNLANGKQFDGNIDGASDNAPYDTVGISITSTTGSAVGRVTILYVSGTAGTQTGRLVISDITMTYNLPPTAVADSFTTVHDTPLIINVRANDTDPNGDTLTVTQVNGTAIIVGGPGVAVTGGVVTLSVAGNLVFTPNANYAGSPSFNYTVIDGNGGTATAIVNGTVTNAAPVVDLNSAGSTSSTGPSVVTANTTANLVANGTFADNSATPASWTEEGTNGTGVSGRYIWTTAGQTLFQNLALPAATSATSTSTVGNTTTTTVVESRDQLTSLSFDLAWQNADVTPQSAPGVPRGTDRLTVSYNGVIYATFDTFQAGTVNAAGLAGTWAYYNGASGPATTNSVADEATGALSNISITLPVGITASGVLKFYIGDNLTGAGSDDIAIDNIVATSTKTTTTTTLSVTNADDVSGLNYTATYTENGTPVSISSAAGGIRDVDDTNMESATVTLTNQQTGDRLLVNGSAAASGTLASGITWTRTDTSVTLSGTFTKAQYAAAIQAIQFENTTDTPSTTPRTINVTVNDGALNSNTAVTTINIDLAPDPVNDAFSGNEDATVGGNVLANDADVGTTPSIANPLSIVTGPANGVLTSFNTATGAFVYTPAPNFNGTDSFVYRYTDANGDSKTATVMLTVNPVNDAPVNTVPSAQSTPEDTPLTISGVSVNDVDGAATVLTTTLTVPAGTGVLNIGSSAGVTVSGDGSRMVTITGTAAAINGAIATITYTPIADYNTGTPAAPINLTVATTDGTLTDTDTISITITPIADIANDSVTTNEDTPVTFAPLGNDSFENSGRLITAINGTAITAGGAGVVIAGVGTVTLDAAGNLTFTPNANYNGTPSFTYTVTSGGVTETATVNVTVNSVNDAPVNTVPAAQMTSEDGAAIVVTGVSVADADGGALTTTLTIPAGSGTLSVVTGGGATISGNGTGTVTLSGTAAQINAAIASITYVPTADFNGAPSLTVVTSDGSLSDSDAIAITVTPVADITNDAVSTNEDTAATFNVLTGTNGATVDTFENAGAAVTSVTQGANGTVSFAANGAITYTPNASFNGTDSFTYTVTSGGVTETATVTVTVTADNDAPINTVPPAQTTIEDTNVVFSAANGNAITVSDADSAVSTTLTIVNGTLTLGSVSGVTVTGNGTGTVTVSGTPAAITAALNGLTFAPVADWNGTTTLNVTTSDGVAAAVASTVSITAAPVVDIAPNGVITNEDTASTFNVLANDTFENPGQVISSVTQPANGTVTFLASGDVTYTPNADYNGTDSFTYTVTSGGVTETTTATMTVTAVNDAPAATTLVAQSNIDGSAASYDTGPFFSDADGDTLTFSVTGLPAGLSINPATGQISGTIDSHASTGGAGGVYSVAVTATDPFGALVTRTFNWTVTNPAPVASNDAYTGNEDISITGNVLTNDSDPDGDALTVTTTPVSGPSNGTLVLNGNGSFTYTPALNFTGTDSFTYEVVDADGATQTATVTLYVNPVDDSPVNSVPGNQATPEDTPLVFSTANGNAITVTDVDSLSVTTTVSVAQGTLTLGSTLGVTVTGNGTDAVTLTGTPAAITAALNGLSYVNSPDYNGADTLSIVSTDGIATTIANLALTVSPVADITADSVTTNEDTSISFNVLTGTNGASADAFEGVPSVTGFTQPANGAVTVLANGNVVYTPNINFNGTDSFTYTVTSGGVTETTTVTVNVNSVNDTPAQVLPPAQTGTEDTSVVFGGANGNQIVISDVDGGANVATTLSVPAGTLAAITTPGVTITGNGTGTVTLSGSPTAVTAALNGLTYTPVADANGTVTMTVSTSDGVAAPVNGTVAMTLAPVSDITDDTVSTSEDTLAVIAVLGNDTFENAGRTVSAVDGLAITAGGAAVAVANGTVTLDAFGNLTFTPAANYNGITTFSYTVTSGGVTETATVTVVVNAVNDAPTQTAPAAQTTTEDAGLTFSGASGNAIVVADLDGDALTTIVTVTNGTIDLGTFTGVTVTGNGTGTVVISGSAAAINAALDGLTYNPVADYNGAAVMSVTTTDGSATVSNSVPITVTSVVDIAADTATTNEDTPVTFNVLSNDTFENPGAAVTNVTQGVNGTVTIGAGGGVTYTPDANTSGPDSFTYTVTSGGVTETVTVMVNVIPVNDAVVTAVPGGQSTNEDAALIFSSANGNAITVSDVDAGDTITMTLSGTNGALTLGSIIGVTVSGNGTGTVTLSGSAAAVTAALNGLSFAPTADYNGTASISVITSDGTATSNDSIDVTVTPVVDIVADTVSTAEDAAVTFNALTNDSFESPGRAVTSVTQGASGTVSFLSNGTLVYTPDTNFNGSDTFTYTVTSGGVTETTTVTVNVGAVNDVPTTTGLADRNNLDGQFVSVNVSASFADSDGDPLTYTATGLPAGLTINPVTGIISGTIDISASQAGPYTVTVTASDGNPGGTVSTAFNWAIDNPAPAANNDSASAAEDTLTNITVLANDTDPDSDPLTVTGATAGNGTVTIKPDGTIDYTPNLNFNGTDTIVYQISDGNGGISTATVTVTVTPVNDAPVATSLGDLTDSDSQNVSIDVTPAFSDVDGDTLTYSADIVPPGLTFNPVTGVFSGTLDPGASAGGPYVITVTADDGNGGTASTTFTWTVLNIPPSADDDSVTTPEDTPVVATVLANDIDPDNDPLIITEINGTPITAGGPAVATPNGSVVLTTDSFGQQILIFTPTADWNGVESLVYTTDDGNGGSDTATLTITVTPANDAPTADPIANLTNNDSDAVSTGIGAFFHDIDTPNGDTLTFSALGLPLGLAINPVTGVISGTIDRGASQGGPYTVVVTATDSAGAAVSQTFTWTVNNPAPTAVNDAQTVAEGANLTVNAATGVLVNDTDPDNDTLTVSAINGAPASVGQSVAGSAGGLFTVNADGSYTFDQNGAFEDLQSGDTRVTTVTYTLSDGNGGISTATLSISVTGANDAPTAGTLPNLATVDNAPLTLNAASAFSDVDGDTLTYSLDPGTPLPAGLMLNAAGMITGTIDKSASQGGVGGVYTITVIANDGQGGLTPVTFTITVTNPAPVAANDVAPVTEDTPASGNVLTNDSDPDGDPLQLTGFTIAGVAGAFNPGDTAAIPGVGTLTMDATGAYTFTPEPSYNGAVPEITYTLSDGDGGTGTATLNLGPVLPVNGAPASTPVAPQSNNDSDMVVFNVSPSFTDVDGDPLTFSIDPANPLPPGLTIDPSTGLITGTIDHLASGSGPYAVRIIATDPSGLMTSQTFTWNVANPAPTGPVIADTTGTDGTAVNIPAGTGFADPDGDTLTFTASGLPSGLSINPATGLITGTLGNAASAGGPLSDGVYSITVTATDEQGLSVARTFTYTVGNPAPTAGNDFIDGTEDTPLTSTVAANDQDPDGDAATYALVTGPAYGTLIFNANGTFTYTPGANYNATDGRDTFTYKIIDAQGAEATATVTLTIQPVNDLPGPTTAAITTPEDTPVSGALPSSDADGDIVSFTLTTGPTNGTVAVNPNGTYTYTPAPDFTGSDTFVVRLSDGNGGFTLQTVSVTVTPINDPPVASNTTMTTPEDTTFNGSLPGATDADGDLITYTQATGPSQGTLTVNLDGTYSYAPNLNYNGPDSFTYTVSDGNGGSNTYTVTIQVGPGNDPPVASDTTITTNEDTPAVGSLPVATDIDGDPITYAKASDPAHGTLTVSPGGTYVYTPVANYNGPDSFTYSVSDGFGGTNTYTVTLTVIGVSDVPVAVNDAFNAVEDTPMLGDVTPMVPGQDSDPDNDTLSVVDTDGNPANGITPVSGPANGSLVLNADGTFSYTPDANFNGTDSFTYRISDGNGGFSEAVVTLTINPVNDLPVAGPDALTTPEDQPFTGSLPPATDIDGDTVTYSKVSNPAYGTVVVNPNGTYTYTPNPNYNGADTFTYTVSDGNGGVATYTVTVMVLPVSDVPVIAAFTPPASTDGSSVRFDVSVFTSDADGDTLTYTATGLPPGLSIDPATGVVTGTLPRDASQGGPYTVTLTVSDGNGGVVTRSFTWPVTNPVPIATDDSAIVKSGKDVLVPVLANDYDPDGDPLTVTTAQASNGSVVILPDGSIRYTPRVNFAGTDTITYVVSDGNGGFAIASVTITVFDDGYTEKPTIFGFNGPERGIEPPSFASNGPYQGITADGAVIDAVFNIGELHSLANQLSEDGAVLAAANGVRSLGGIGSLGANGVIVETIRAERAREIADMAGFGRSFQDYKLDGLPGFSMRRDVPGNLGGLSAREQIIIESIVRERTLIVQITNTLETGSKRIVDYRITQADGTPLPDWLDRAGTNLLIGRRAADLDTLKLRVEAVYSDGSIVVEEVKIDTATGEIQPLKNGRQGSAAPALFSDQFRSKPMLTPDQVQGLGRAIAR